MDKQKNIQAWAALRQFVQPALVASVIGLFLKELAVSQVSKDYPLLEPMVSFPLAGLAVASLVNAGVLDLQMVVKNYMFFFLKGLMVSIAIFLSSPVAYLFVRLNEGWMKDIFSGNLLHPVHGTGMRTMVIFHSLNLFISEELTRFVYG